ncbi:hypothetical protein Pla100_22580 [Neorhodopirellula pilleata]|uniref:Uncharacterized protein n=1 Tax=Neorhodopirellula pilleata TaxID=2714738 RepID=A0A5C6ABZ4_9BACT|nr:hypothetical protein Pla100_22580 [Neorhodopirellula pilleata]
MIRYKLQTSNGGKTGMLARIIVAATICLLGIFDGKCQEPQRDPELKYPEYTCQADDLVISRSEYYDKLRGFWLGQCIANWTGLRTEGLKKTAPFFTDKERAIEPADRISVRHTRFGRRESG